MAVLQRSDLRAAPFFTPPKAEALYKLDLDAVVDLSLLGLDKIETTPGGDIQIGSLVTLAEWIDSQLLADTTNGLLPHAARLAAGSAIRNLACLGGVLLAADGPPETLLALLALEAKVLLPGSEQKSVSLSEFLEARRAASRPLEIPVAVLFKPLSDECGVALERVARTAHDEAIVAAVAVLEAWQGMLCRASLAVAGASPNPVRIGELDRLLEDQPLAEAQIERAVELTLAQVDPAGDYRGSAEYRRAMAGVLAKRALENAWKDTRRSTDVS
jgi:CO/xanthine dehydrogenase FAD-binding subunit